VKSIRTWAAIAFVLVIVGLWVKSNQESERGFAQLQADQAKRAAAAPAPAQPAKAPEGMTRRTATAYCMQFIKQALHDPGSADFANSDEATVQIKGSRAMVIRSVRAKNAFGALRLQEFMCLLEEKGGKVTAAFVGPKGENAALASSILEQWKLSE